jgi:hypothetical protein
MKGKFAVLFLVYASAVLAGKSPEYPTENVAQFVVEKLDANSLPAALRPKHQKEKKTLAEYGYSVEKMEGTGAVVQGGGRRLSIAVLEQNGSGIFACVSEPAATGDQPKAQSVVLLKRKDASALLRSQLSSREFAACPVIGGEAEEPNGGSY